MGSRNGKYDFEHANSMPNLHPTIPHTSTDPKLTKKSRPSDNPLPLRCLHHDRLVDRSTTHADNLSLVWLDSQLYQRTSNIDTEIKLKNVVEYIRVFDRVDACERYIKQIGRLNNNEYMRKEKLLVIISTALAPTLTPHLHDLSQVQAIYVFGKAKTISKAHQEWLSKYPKVNSLHSSSSFDDTFSLLGQRCVYLFSNIDCTNFSRSNLRLSNG